MAVHSDFSTHRLASRAGVSGGMCTVLEVSGKDRYGLLAEVMDAFAASNCTVWSASIWTNNRGRATFVLGVRDVRQPLSDEANWRQLRDTLYGLLGGAEHGATVTKDAVVRAWYLCACRSLLSCAFRG
jgi:predicted amino acid-binding ACT domain protein